jgi:phosphoglycolate phosphatase-like HAD superfamily hydrolase
MLTALHQAGYSLGVVTGKSRRAWELTAQHVNLGQLHCWIFDDDVSERKPSPVGITCALTRLQTPSTQAMYVGDGLTDVRAARTAGVLAGAVLWPKRAAERAVFAEEARALGAVIFETPDDVVEYVSTSLPTEDIT